MEIEEIVSRYAKKLANDEIEYSELDSILNKMLLNPGEIVQIKAQIDEIAQNIILNRNEFKLKKQQFIQGVIIFGLGACITVASFFKLGVFSGSKVYFISAGLMGFGGFSIFKSKQNEEKRDPKKRMKRYFEKK